MAASKFTTNVTLLNKFQELDQKGSVIAEYIWIDSTNGTRSKCKTLKSKPKSLKDLPEWNFDGSSTEQAPGDNSDVYLRPVAMYPDPFRLGDNILVLCETYMSDGKPNTFNFRHDTAILMEKHKQHHTWFGLEQEYTMLDGESGWPYGWPVNGYPAPQGPYYCGNGTGKAFGRDVVDSHYRACLYAGISISGTNAEVMAGQWEYQVGPCEGIDMGDELWVSRFLLQRVAEMYGIKVSFAPKPVAGDWNGAGLHTNVSSLEMREDGGFQKIVEAMKKLEGRHKEHMMVYGEGNELRMTGKHETAAYDKFSWGVANRGSSCRINREVEQKGKGYFEDRRPASNGDPYQITGMIVETLYGKAEGANVIERVKQAEQAEM